MSRKYPDDSRVHKTNSGLRGERKLSRSSKLRKYESVYKSYVRKIEKSKISKSPRRGRTQEKPTRSKQSEEDKTDKTKDDNTVNKNSLPISKRKNLNSYQKFVKSESKKDKYMKLPGKERLIIIASEWKKINK